MIQTGIETKKIIDFIKNHLSVLIIVPAFIGGTWQALELMLISFPYIRFFSISQIVPDGLLILMFLIGTFSYNVLGWLGNLWYIVIGNRQYTDDLEPNEYEKYRKSELIVSIILFLIMYTILAFFYIYFFYDKSKSEKLSSILVVSFISIMILNQCLNRCYYFAKGKSKGLIKKYGNFLLLTLYILGSIFIGKNMHNAFLAPNNIVNIEQVKSDVIKKFPNTKQEVLYFNDKYIFIKIIEKDKKDKRGNIIRHMKDKVYIEKFESLFEE